MCGIFGLAATNNRRLSLDATTICRLRDRLARRGPDDAGLWSDGRVALAHRRLAIIDPDHGRQPLEIGTPGERDHFLLTYNGELYNHRQLRRELERCGHHFETNCDTETVLHAIAQWGEGAFDRFRGMFALAVFYPATSTLTLARDPLGVKPLYYALIDTPAGREFAFASEPPALLGHPHLPKRPDWGVVSSYLTTIRTTLGSRSMFEGIEVVQPGEMVRVDLSGDRPEVHIETWYAPPSVSDVPGTFEDAATELARLMDESVEAHLLSDVPTCALLSGGVDSSVICLLATPHLDRLNTFCAGAPILGETNDDFTHARTMAQRLESNHVEVAVRMAEFNELWPWMIGELGVPLSTPNEVAIHMVARRLAEDATVTLSGEGADELFAGYDATLGLASRFFDGFSGDSAEAATFALGVQAWIDPADKPTVVNSAILDRADHDQALQTEFTDAFEGVTDGASGFDAFLRAQQRFNLTGLLGRLDTATMLASVEGRTPFADRIVAEYARSLPLEYLYRHDTTKPDPGLATGGNAVGAATASATEVTTKRVLRQAFADRLPREIIERPKASFPLPFQYWLSDHAARLDRSSGAKEVFTSRAIDAVRENSAGHWSLAWPMINLSRWLDHHWG